MGHKYSKVTKPDFSGKISFPSFGPKRGKKKGFLNIKENCVVTFCYKWCQMKAQCPLSICENRMSGKNLVLKLWGNAPKVGGAVEVQQAVFLYLMVKVMLLIFI